MSRFVPTPDAPTPEAGCLELWRRTRLLSDDAMRLLSLVGSLETRQQQAEALDLAMRTANATRMLALLCEGAASRAWSHIHPTNDRKED